jgi:4'-phosphopantetheinyl transferase
MVSIYGVKLLDELRFFELKGLLHACLPQEVCEVASRFKYPAGKQRKVLGELLLRSIIHRDHQINTRDLQIAYTEKDKPYLKSHPHIHFNISHSGDWVVIAFSDKPVGVDIEKIRNVNLGVAQRFFSEHEKKVLFSLGQKEQLRYFFDLWTLKESFLKAIGTGLTRPLKSFTVMQSANGFYLQEAGEYQHAVLSQIPVDRYHRLSVCSFSKQIDQQFHTLYINDMLELMAV